jgi:hypothetical protein
MTSFAALAMSAAHRDDNKQVQPRVEKKHSYWLEKDEYTDEDYDWYDHHPEVALGGRADYEKERLFKNVLNEALPTKFKHFPEVKGTETELYACIFDDAIARLGQVVSEGDWIDQEIAGDALAYDAAMIGGADPVKVCKSIKKIRNLLRGPRITSWVLDSDFDPAEGTKKTVFNSHRVYNLSSTEKLLRELGCGEESIPRILRRRKKVLDLVHDI